MRPDVLGQPGAAAYSSAYPPGFMPVQPVPGRAEEDRSGAAFADSQVDRASGSRGERDDSFLTALAGDRQDAVTALAAQVLNVRADSLGHPQPVQGQQRYQRVLSRRAEPGGDEEGTDLVAV